MKLIWYPAVSLDGYIADARGSSDFVTPEDDRQFTKLAVSAGAVVVGRRTFDQYRGQNYPIPGTTTYILTRNRDILSYDPAIVYVTGGPMELMRRLHDDGHATAVLSGGGQINGLFAEANFIDEAWISVYPIILGAGTPLLGSYKGSLRLAFRAGYAFPGGVVHNRYEVT
ncbi:MAG: dihydrofolate reductase [Patescibacteria group bacterium]|nr:dihydrofolate reductase [Patescibacteria group bacterium]